MIFEHCLNVISYVYFPFLLFGLFWCLLEKMPRPPTCFSLLPLPLSLPAFNSGIYTRCICWWLGGGGASDPTTRERPFPDKSFPFISPKKEEHPYFRKGERESFPIQPYRAAADAGIKSFFSSSPPYPIYIRRCPQRRGVFIFPVGWKK